MNIMKIRNWNKIFLISIAIEIIILLILIFFWNQVTLFPNSCYTSDFFHPFGRSTAQEGQVCLLVFTEGTNPLIYLTLYVLILTIITEGVYLIRRKLNKKK